MTRNRLRSSIRRVADPYHFPRIPQSLLELQEMLLERQQLHVTMDCRDSLFRGDVGVPGHASAIFMSTRISSYLRHVDIVFCDGTFASRSSRPRTSQVFQISTTIRNHVSCLIRRVHFNQVSAQTEFGLLFTGNPPCSGVGEQDHCCL